MFEKLNTLWIQHGFEILIGLSLAFIFVFWIINKIKGSKGTWSNKVYLPSQDKAKKPFQESKGEVECRRVVEKIYGKPFPKARPDFLRNPITVNFNLELDCYNDELKIGVEYNGVQHYKYTPYFHKNYEAFQNQKYRDYLKAEMCQKNGIKLIEVPYTVKVEDIEKHIMNKLKI